MLALGLVGAPRALAFGEDDDERQERRDEERRERRERSDAQRQAWRDQRSSVFDDDDDDDDGPMVPVRLTSFPILAMSFEVGPFGHLGAGGQFGFGGGGGVQLALTLAGGTDARLALALGLDGTFGGGPGAVYRGAVSAGFRVDLGSYTDFWSLAATYSPGVIGGVDVIEAWSALGWQASVSHTWGQLGVGLRIVDQHPLRGRSYQWLMLYVEISFPSTEPIMERALPE